MATIDSSLVRILAETDELFFPVRDWDQPRNVSGIYERRQEFLQAGLPHAAGGTGAERIAAHRAADTLEQSGFVVFHRTNGKRSHVRLLPEKYWELRFWSLLPGERELSFVVAGIQANVARGCVYANTTFVPEWALIGQYERVTKAAKQRVVALMEAATPGLVFGWLDSDSTVDGAVYYRVTDAGEQHFTNWSGPTFTPPAYDPKLAEETAEQYIVACREARLTLARLKGQPNNLAVSLNCGLDPDPDTACEPIIDRRGKFRMVTST